MNDDVSVTILYSRKILSVIVFIFLMTTPFTIKMGIYEESNKEDGEIGSERPKEFQNDHSNMKRWFTENQGQIDNSDVKFTYTTSELSIGFLESGYLIKLSNEENLTSIVKVSFEGAKRIEPQGVGLLPHMSNYFRGNDSAQWEIGVRNYQEVLYENLYDGIDLHFFINDIGLKYDLIVAPGADSSNIAWTYQGEKFVNITDTGDLLIQTLAGGWKEEMPFCYQNKGTESIEIVKGEFVFRDGAIRIKLEEYDQTYPLIIDPLIYSTYLGGDEEENGLKVVNDDGDCTYVTGVTRSIDFPTTPGAYDETHNAYEDVFVIKLSPDGSQLLYSTFIGGSSVDYGFDISLDSENNAYVTGTTISPNFPTTSQAYDTTPNGNGDAFCFKLNPSGSDLVYSTLLGGTDGDAGLALVLDNNYNAIISGVTASFNYPTTVGAYDESSNGEGDVFVTKLNSDGSDLEYSTYLGGSGYEESNRKSIAIDKIGNVYVAGETESEDFPTTEGCYDDNYDDSRDLFISKLNPDGSNLLYSTYVGGHSSEDSREISYGDSGLVYVVGGTNSDDFPTTEGCFDDSYGGESPEKEGYFLIMNTETGNLTYSTFIGGSGWDRCESIVLDDNNNIYITGTAGSEDFPVTNNSYNKTNQGSTDVFVMKFGSKISNLIYSTYFGGSSPDNGESITLDSNGFVIVTGYTESEDFPTTNGTYDQSYNGMEDIFIFKLELDLENGDGNGNDNDENDNWYNESIPMVGIILGIIIIGIVALAFVKKKDNDMYSGIETSDDFNDDRNAKDESDEEW